MSAGSANVDLRQYRAPGGDLRWLAPYLLGAAAAAAVFAYSAYAVSPLALPLLLAGVAVAAVAFASPAWGLSLAMAALPLELLSVRLGGGALSPSETIFVLVALGWLARAVFQADEVVRPSLRDAPIAVLLLTYVLGLFVAHDTSVVIRVFLFWLAFYFIYLQVQSLRVEEMRRIVVALGIGVGILGAIATIDYLGSKGAQFYNGGLGLSGRARGTFTDVNYFASILLLGFFPALALLIRGARRDLPLFVVVLGALAGELFSFSRGGLLGLAFGLLVLLGWGPMRRLTIVLAIGFAVLTILNADPVANSTEYSQLKTRLSTINSTQLTDISENRRPETWRTAIAVAGEHPFIGVGAGNFPFAALEHGLIERGAPIENVHDLPLSFAAENGLIGAAAFIVLIAAWLAAGARAVRNRDRLARALAIGLLAALAGFLIQALTVVPTRVSVIAATLFVIGGMLMALADRATFARGEEPVESLESVPVSPGVRPIQPG